MIFNIFKKELKETLRDRRTIMTMIVIPILLFPIILNVSSINNDKTGAARADFQTREMIILRVVCVFFLRGVV